MFLNVTKGQGKKKDLEGGGGRELKFYDRNGGNRSQSLTESL